MEVRVGALTAITLVVVSKLLFNELYGCVGLPGMANCLVTKLIFNPSLFGVMSRGVVSRFTVVSSVTLSFVTFSINYSFDLSCFGGMNDTPVVITVFRTVNTMVLLAMALVVYGISLGLSVLLNTVTTTATPTRAVVMVGRCGTGNPLASLLLDIITLSSTITLVNFNFTDAVIATVGKGNSEDLILSVLSPFCRILVSTIVNFILTLIVGILLG